MLHLLLDGGGHKYSAAQVDDRGVPVDFDWQEYLELNPDVKASGFDTQNLAEVRMQIAHSDTDCMG